MGATQHVRLKGDSQEMCEQTAFKIGLFLRINMYFQKVMIENIGIGQPVRHLYIPLLGQHQTGCFFLEPGRTANLFGEIPQPGKVVL